jgi:hypothetical protein
MRFAKLPGVTVLLFVCTSTVAQSAGHSLLWFKGHWNKDKKNEFVIEGLADSTYSAPAPAGAGGSTGSDPGAHPAGTITVDPDGSLHPHTGGAEAWNVWVDKGLDFEEKFIGKLNNVPENLDPATHHFYQILLPDAEEYRQELQSYKIDPNCDMLTGKKPAAPPKHEKTLADVVSEYCKDAKPGYDQVMNYYKSHVAGHYNDLNVPPPPAFEYNCYACDSNIRKVYDSAVEHYVRDFMHPEDSIVRKGFDILHNLAIAGYSEEEGMQEELGPLFHMNKKDPSQSGPCAYIELHDLYHAVYETAYHLYLRAEKLVRTNKRNFKAVKAILRTYLSICREWELISCNSDSFKNMEGELLSLIDDNIRFYIDAFTHNDWRTIGNIPFILSLYQASGLLGGENADIQPYLDGLQKVINGFKLSIEMDVKIGKGGGYRIAHLKGDCHIIPDFQQDVNQCYKWVVADENKQSSLGFYMPRNIPAIDCQLLDNEVITPPQAPKITYIGTKKYTALLQSLSMDFCNPGHDTINLTGFMPNPSTAGTWQIPYAGPQNLGANGMEQYFEDVDAKKRFAEDGEAQQEAETMKQQGLELKKQMEALKARMSSGNGAANYEKIMELAGKARHLTTTPVAAKMIYLDFLLPVQNNSPVIVEKKFNAKDINPNISDIIVYGYYTIHIENNGNGKTKKTSLK